MSWIQNDDNHTFEQNGTFRGLGEGRLLPIVLIGLTLLLGIGFKYYGGSFNNINFLEKLQKNKEISQQPMQNDNSIYDSYPTPIQERQQPLFDRSVDDTIPMIGGVIVPAVAGWGGKVNQHFNLEKNRWETDLDGVSGNDKISLEYCKKYYPNTTAILLTEQVVTIHSWCEAYNKNCYHVATQPMYEYVQGEIDDSKNLSEPLPPAFQFLY